MRICGLCKSRPTVSKHFNSKWCTPCGDGLRTKPKHNLTPSQQSFVLKNVGRLSKEEMAEKCGASRSSIMRFGREKGISLAAKYAYKANPKLVNQVCAYYASNGRTLTEKAFPKIKVRSIVERYKLFNPRQVRWTDSQMIELAQMAGVISMAAQAKYFNRPRANEGSIASAWMKNFKTSGGPINGLSWYMARHFVTKNCPRIHTKFWQTAKKRKGKTNHHSRWVVTWVDFEKYLLPNSPSWLIDCARSMARFQKWLHQSNNPKRNLNKLLKEREV